MPGGCPAPAAGTNFLDARCSPAGPTPALPAARLVLRPRRRSRSPNVRRRAASRRRYAAAARHTEKKPGISTGAIVAGAIGVAALVGIVAIAATSGKKTQTRYRTRKGKTKYITRKAPKKRKHNRSAHKKR